MARSGSATPLLIFPFNGNGLEALDCLGPDYRLIGFVDDTPEKQGPTRLGHTVYSREAFSRWPSAKVLAVPGSPTSFRSRRQVIESVGIESERFARVIHPTARISPLANIGHNVLVMAGVVITSNAVIGSHVCLLPNTVVHHDVSIGDFSLIGCNVSIAGGVDIDDNCYIGSGSSIMNGVSIARGTLVGLGSNVIRSTTECSVVVGNPARPLR